MNGIKNGSPRRWAQGLALSALLLSASWAAVPGIARAQTGAGGDTAAGTMQPGMTAPRGRVLLFPAMMGGAAGAATATPAAGESMNTPARQAQEAVTDALRKRLNQVGVGVVVYNSRLPSIQRAVSEATITNAVAAAGPGDDPRVARQLAEIAGAAEYITATIDDYKYDPSTRTASFNLSVFRNATSDSAPVGTAAVPGQGIAPGDVAASRQEGSASARAAEAAAEQAVQGLFPQAAAAAMAPAPEKNTSTNRSETRWLLPALGVIFGVLVLSNR